MSLPWRWLTVSCGPGLARFWGHFFLLHFASSSYRDKFAVSAYFLALFALQLRTVKRCEAKWMNKQIANNAVPPGPFDNAVRRDRMPCSIGIRHVIGCANSALGQRKQGAWGQMDTPVRE